MKKEVTGATRNRHVTCNSLKASKSHDTETSWKLRKWKENIYRDHKIVKYVHKNTNFPCKEFLPSQQNNQPFCNAFGISVNNAIDYFIENFRTNVILFMLLIAFDYKITHFYSIASNILLLLLLEYISKVIWKINCSN